MLNILTVFLLKFSQKIVLSVFKIFLYDLHYDKSICYIKKYIFFYTTLFFNEIKPHFSEFNL